MNPRLARWLYSAWLCFLAACAVISSPPEASAPAETAAAPAATPEMELARVVRERAELSTRFGARHPETVRVAQQEETLREASEDQSGFRRALILALSDELAGALRDRREVAARYGSAAPEVRTAQSVVLALTAAINREVQSAG